MRKSQAALVAVAIAALAGGGTAIAAKSHGQTPRAPFADRGGHPGAPPFAAAATYLGTTVDSLLTQLRSGKTLAQIANATSGKSAAGLIDALVAEAQARFGSNLPADLKQHITDLVNGVHDRHGPLGGMHGGPGSLQVAATYLGLTTDALRTQLQSGKTLAQIANATSGKSAQGLIDVLVADARTHITKLVNGTD